MQTSTKSSQMSLVKTWQILALFCVTVTFTCLPSCMRPEMEVAQEDEPPYNRWGWVKLKTSDNTDVVVLILHDTKKAARMKMVFFADAKEAFVKEDSFTIKNVFPTRESWVMQRENFASNAYVGQPLKPDFLVCMYSSVYEITDNLTINNADCKPWNFAYRDNPYELLKSGPDTASFIETTEKAGFPRELQGRFDPLEREKARER